MRPTLQQMRDLMDGKEVQGWTYDQGIAYNGKEWYRLIGKGLQRPHAYEIDNPNDLPYRDQGEFQALPKWFKRVCRECGQEFRCSKHASWREYCNECARNERRRLGIDKKYVCVRCGADYYVSIYRIYDTPCWCPRCSQYYQQHKKQRASDRAVLIKAGLLQTEDEEMNK